jgi:Ca2+-binding EF-hand superfamily protein
MKGMKQIQPIVTKKRVDGTQKRSKHDLIDNNDEGYLTAITHLDPIEPIDEDTFDMYSALTRRIMKFMNKSHNDALDYEEFKVAMSMSGVNVVESRVLSLFSAVHFGEQNQLNFTDFETALMIHDCCPPSSSHHSVFDIFSSFDLDNCGQLTFEQFKECVNSICFQWGSNPKDSEYLAFLFCKAVPSPLERLNYKSFTQLWSGKLADKKVFLGLGSSKQVTRKVKHPTLRKLTSFVLSSWRWVKRKELLQKEITKPGFDMIITFHEMRKQVVERRLEAQKLFHHNRHIIKEAKSKHKRKGVVSASRRKKDLSLILRDEGAKTLAMLEENRILRDKILKELQGLKHNVDIFNHSSVRTKIHEEIQHSYTSMEDKLILRDIRLSEVPLSLYNDKISQLRLSDLKIIDLSGNRLVHLPETNFFFHLISVRKLCLSRNNLATIPDEIGLMNRVEIILVEGNLLNQLPPRISNLENLQVLDLSNNRVNELQDDLCHLPSLKVLSLHSNNITLISHLIGKLTTLCSIDLSNNKIKYIPETFCSLARLIKINISNNVLLELPFQFGSLEGLEDLNISFNNIHVSLSCVLTGVENFYFIISQRWNI